MLVIGHRGAAGLAPENSLAAVAAGIEAGADIIEIDVRETKDKQLIVWHDARLVRSYHTRVNISRLTYHEVRQSSKNQPIELLETILDQFFGKVLINIEVKSRGSGVPVLNLLQEKYIKRPADWDKVLISSFMGYELVRMRRVAKKANLALLHNENPFIFVAYHRFINLTAVGFHRLYLNRLAIEIAKKAGLFIYVYTVDRPGALKHIASQGIDGIVTNYPDKILKGIEKLEA